MTEPKDKHQRRVYVLPSELVERIAAFQKETGLTSEVEAARRLLDDALKSRDTFVSITGRLVARFRETRSLRDAARDVLASHPLVDLIRFEEAGLAFRLKNGINVTVDDRGRATVRDERDDLVTFGNRQPPEWASEEHPRRTMPKPGTSAYDEMDDEIPF